MSRSRTVSRKRRAEPAIETSTAAGCAATSASTAREPRQRRARAARGAARSARRRLRELDEDPLLELRPDARDRRAARCASAAARRSATVVIPSSCQIRRAVFGPSPGSCMNVATSGGTSRLALRERVRSRRRRPPGRSSPRSSCRSPAAPSRARRARAARPSSTSRGSAPPPAGRRATRKESPPWSSIRSASRSNCAARSAFFGSVRLTAADDTRAFPRDWPRRCARRSASRPTTSARTSSAMLRALGEVLREGDRVLVIDDGSPDGTGELADRLAGGARLRRRPPPHDEGGARARVPRRASGARSTTAPSSCSRWTATSRTTRRTCRG